MEWIKSNLNLIIPALLVLGLFLFHNNSEKTYDKEIKEHIQTINSQKDIINKQAMVIRNLEINKDIIIVEEIKPDGSKKITKTDKSKIKQAESVKTSDNSISLKEEKTNKILESKEHTVINPNRLYIGVGTDASLHKNIHLDYSKGKLKYGAYGSTDLNWFGVSVMYGF